MPAVTRAVLFDLDHTLFDTRRSETVALRTALRERGLPFSGEILELYRRINLELWAAYRAGEIDQPRLALERFRRLLRELGLPGSGARPLGRRYLGHFSRRGDLLPGCRSTLRRLGRRFVLGVVTNGIDRIQRSRLAASRLRGHFAVVVTSQGSGFAKPDPRILEVALTALGVGPEAALYVGDDPGTDGVAASAAGVPFCWLDGGAPYPRSLHRPRHRIRSLPELPGRLGLGKPRAADL